MTDDEPAVLVVEDERDLRATVAEVLRMEGYRVWEAADGEEALEELEAHGAADLILLDVMMPVMDGYGFRRRQLEEQDWADIPVVLFTSSKEAAGEDFDAVEVLRKPVGIARLVDAVDRHVTPRQSDGA